MKAARVLALVLVFGAGLCAAVPPAAAQSDADVPTGFALTPVVSEDPPPTARVPALRPDFLLLLRRYPVVVVASSWLNPTPVRVAPRVKQAVVRESPRGRR